MELDYNHLLNIAAEPVVDHLFVVQDVVDLFEDSSICSHQLMTVQWGHRQLMLSPSTILHFLLSGPPRGC